MEIKIETHCAWHGAMTHQGVEHLLAEQPAFTYVLTEAGPADYFLSYIRGSDRKVIHIHFNEVYDAKGRFCGYKNYAGGIFSSVDTLIRYKLKGRGIPPVPVAARLSA
jgi:hypothetical protein